MAHKSQIHSMEELTIEISNRKNVSVKKASKYLSKFLEAHKRNPDEIEPERVVVGAYILSNCLTFDSYITHDIYIT